MQGETPLICFRHLDHQGCANRVEQDIEDYENLEVSNEDDGDGADHLQEPVDHVKPG